MDGSPNRQANRSANGPARRGSPFGARSDSPASWAPVLFWFSVLALFGVIAHLDGVRGWLEISGLQISGRALGLLSFSTLMPVGLVAFYAGLRVRRKQTTGKLPGTWPLIEQAATVGLAGYAPLGPGTVGAVVAVPIVLSISQWSLVHQIAVLGGIVFLSAAIVHQYVKHSPDDDPSEVVLDELTGCAITLCFVPAGAAWLAAAFVLFRVLDIFKPWPIGFVDRRIKGGIGVVADDVIAGLLAGALLLSLNRLGIACGWWA